MCSWQSMNGRSGFETRPGHGFLWMVGCCSAVGSFGGWGLLWFAGFWCLPEVMFRWSLSAPRPGVYAWSFDHCEFGGGRMSREESPGLDPLREQVERRMRGRPACGLTLAPLRPRRVINVRTLALAGAGMRIWDLTGWPCATGLDHLWRDWDGCSSSSKVIMGSCVRVVKG